MKQIILLAMAFCVLFVNGCARMPEEKESVITVLPEPEKQGVYHKVKKGETLWRIAKAYDIPINDIIHVNNIPDAAQVEEGQLVFMPGADGIKTIILDDDKENEKDFVWPVKGKVVRYFKSYNHGQPNKGIDIQVSAGEDVRAARRGKVIFADYLAGYGDMVVIDHEDGLLSVYAQNSKLFVKVGDGVVKNTVIAKVRPQDNQLPYLHFQIRRNSAVDNPLYYLP